MYICEFRCPQGPAEGAEALELDLQVVVSSQTWVLRIQLRSSARTEQAPTAEPSFHPHHKI